MPKILLVGRGHIATILRRYLQISDADHYQGQMQDFEWPATWSRYDAVVNTAGKTDLAWCEANKGESFEHNVIAPLRMMRKVPKDIPFIHLSSGCVWDGPFPAIGLAFTPNEPPTPACHYSWTKAACDALMMQESQLGRKLAILRPRQVFSELKHPRNTLTKLLGYPKLIDTPNSMTSAAEIVKTVKGLVQEPRLIESPRIINVYNPGYITPYMFGCRLAEAGLRQKPERLEKEELDKTLVPKRVDVVMEDWWFEHNFHPTEIEDAIEITINSYKGMNE